MEPIRFESGEGLCERVRLEDIAASVGTPCYVYSASALRERVLRLQEAFREHPTTLCFAVKANANLAVLATLAKLGAGGDVVSSGELARALKAGMRADRIVFSGVGKQNHEIDEAIHRGILGLNLEAVEEIDRVAARARALGKVANVGIRLNPDISADTNPHLATGHAAAKFGIAERDLPAATQLLLRRPEIRVTGLSCHIGSQLLETDVFELAGRKLSEVGTSLRSAGLPLEWVDAGGGLGIRYREGESEPSLKEYARALLGPIAPTGLKLVLEPGRWIAGPSGVLLTRLLFVKRSQGKSFAIVDGAMNDLIRPSLYDAYHEIVPVRRKNTVETEVVDVVGPVCETGDFLGRDRRMPRLDPDDLLVVGNAGAYGATMASQYNGRPRAPEVLVDGGTFRVVRKRESLEDLWEGETLGEE